MSRAIAPLSRQKSSPPRGKAPSASRAEKKQETRALLFDTAMSLFDERGYEAVSIDDIVRATTLARGTFYFHFPTKEDVLLEAVRRGELLILARLSELGPRVRLRTILARTIEAFLEAWEPRRALLPYAGSVSLRRIAGVREESEGDPLRLELARLVVAARDRGEIETPLPGEMLADIFLLQVFAALMTWSTTGQPPVSVMTPALVELFFGGVTGLGRLST